MKTIALVIWIVGGYNDGGAAINTRDLWFAKMDLCEAAAKKIMDAKQHGYSVAVCIRTE
jgi:hypothetical protein